MFSFFKKKKSAFEGYFPIQTDMHSHILPGIDDGAPDLTASIQLIEGLMGMGVRKSIATPHVIGDMFRNNAGTINKALNALQTELSRLQIDFEVSAAAEYMLDSYFLELLSSKEPLLTIQNNLLLTEFSYASKPVEIESFTFAIQSAGYSPILAHPERYPYFINNLKNFHRLMDLGFIFQINLASLTGYYGKDACRAAEYLLKNNLVAFIGTDIHHERHLRCFQDPKNQRTFKQLLGDKEWNTFL
jgi:tyrosine-protein phosphatase YwqE